MTKRTAMLMAAGVVLALLGGSVALSFSLAGNQTAEAGPRKARIRRQNGSLTRPSRTALTSSRVAASSASPQRRRTRAGSGASTSLPT